MSERTNVVLGALGNGMSYFISFHFIFFLFQPFLPRVSNFHTAISADTRFLYVVVVVVVTVRHYLSTNIIGVIVVNKCNDRPNLLYRLQVLRNFGRYPAMGCARYR